MDSVYQQSKRDRAIERLGGVVCRGLSFIGGPECPVPSNLLTSKDINFSHRKSMPKDRNNIKSENRILRMKNPNKEFILLCCLCNQRMRHLAHEFRSTELPKKVITLYINKHWTLERIAIEYGCCYSTVSKFLKRNGVKIRQGSKTGGLSTWANPITRQKLLKERRTRWLLPERIRMAKIMSGMYDAGDSLRDIAQWFGITHQSIRTHLKLIGEL
jgi:hypothetical protein